MVIELEKYRQQKTRKTLLIVGVSFIVLMIVAALMHIGAGDAEWAGMSVSAQTPALKMEFGIPKDETGVVVDWAEDPAYSAGVRTGDLIKAINNKPIKNLPDFLKVTSSTSLEPGALLDILRNGQPLYITVENKKGLHDSIKKALNIDPGTTGVAKDTNLPAAGAHQVAFGNQLPAETAEAGAPGAMKAAVVDPRMRLPTPKEQGAAQKEYIEGHWLGMELIPLVPELAKEYQVPVNVEGLLVDEISLEAAESGILAGDLVVAVEDFATPDLVSFTEATRRVKNRHKAKVLVSRRGKMMEFTFTSLRTIGFSQSEAAQPITPGALSPHRSRNKPCTACHIIMLTGGQLPTDAGDIIPSAPPIIKGAVPPHENRGKCNSCHFILKKPLL